MTSFVKIIELNFIPIWFTWSNLHPDKLSGLSSSWARLFFLFFMSRAFLIRQRYQSRGGLDVSRDNTSAYALRHISCGVLYSTTLYFKRKQTEKHSELNGPEIDSTLWNGMMELVDMLGKSILGSISRLWTRHLKKVGGIFRVPFCDPTEGVLEFPFGDVFCMRGHPLKGEKSDLLLDFFFNLITGFSRFFSFFCT